ncbi:MAG: hypothetical protein V4792_00835 [Pseudomonadota bacterium]
MMFRKPMAAALSALLFPRSETCLAANGNEWSFWIEQDGRKFQPESALVLAKKPFAISFRGSPDDDYGFAATSVLGELPRTDDLSSVFRASNGLLVDDPNTKISISGPGVIKKGWSSWNMWAYHAPSEVDLISGFQVRTANPDGTVTLTRTVDTLCLDDGHCDICGPIGSTAFSTVHALVTRTPILRAGQSIRDRRWLDPKVVSIEFR